MEIFLQIERAEGILQLFQRDVQIELDAIPNLNDADAANLGKRGKAAKPCEHLPRAPCSYDRCNRMPKKPLDIVPKASHIQRQIRIERSDRKGNHSA